MRARYLVIGLVVVLAAVTGVLIYQGNQTQTAGRIVADTRGHGSRTDASDPYGRDDTDRRETTAAANGTGRRRTCR